MNETLVMNDFCTLTGLSAEEALSWLSLCRSSIQRLTSSLGSWADIQANEERLALAAAGMAAYSWSTLQGGNVQGENFTIGDISIGSSSGTQSGAKETMESLLDLIRDLLQPDGFALLTVG